MQLGYFENFLYSKKLELGTEARKVLNNLDCVSHYFQNNGSDFVSEKIRKSVEELFNSSDDDKLPLVIDCNDGYKALNRLSEFLQPVFSSIENPSFYFIDLFAGIGGFRLACQNNGGKCVFSSEWDPDAQKTYFHNFGEYPFGDITSPETKNYIPDNFDLLCAGFPCQAFSIAGYRKGFEDTRGTLFFDVATIIREKRPKAFILENVKNLVAHDDGRTFDVIHTTLTDLGYKVFYKVLNSMEYANIPQNRERIIIVGFDPQQVRNHEDFRFPEKQDLTNSIHDCIDYTETDESLFYRENHRYYPLLLETMVDPDTIYQWRRQYVRQNKSNVCPTLTANMGMGGHNVPLIITPHGFRKLTPKECLNFQGFPENFEFPPIAKSKQYKQAGNSVTVPLIQSVVRNIIRLL
ncbi:MAG: DNA cytosine methyltransferase [Muribaculaceae bacterium]|nr:DNA cytosine methyltransferase [Muribaculaceae bacterium]